MSYFVIGGIDFSPYVSSLKIKKNAIYNSQTNASGYTMIDYVSTKRTIEVEIIPLDGEKMKQLQELIEYITVAVSFMNPKTNSLEMDVPCYIPQDEVEYYTIRADKTQFKAVSLTFIEM